MKDNLNSSNVSHSKHKSHLSFGIGSDAASSYYFSSVPKTPAVKSARKKLRQSSSSAIKNNLILQSNQEQGEERENKDPQWHDNLSLLEDTFDDGLANNNDASSTSLLFSPHNEIHNEEDHNSHHQDWNHNDSNVSSTYSDNLNKSVLSDTTELTASNYVFAAASRNRLEESMMEFKAMQKLKKQEREIQDQIEEHEPMLEHNLSLEESMVHKDDEANTQDLQGLLEGYTLRREQNDSDHEIDQYLKGNDDSSTDGSLLHESTTNDSPSVKNDVQTNKIVPLMEEAMKFEDGESFLSINDSAARNSITKDVMDEDITVHSHQSHFKNTPSSVSKKDDNTSNVLQQLSSTPSFDLSFSASRSRRLSAISLQRPESELKKHSRRIQSITESITKSRQYRESIKKSVARARNSLPPSVDFAAGLSALNHLEKNLRMNHAEEEEDHLEATFKANNTRAHLDTTFDQCGDKINDILGDLNHDADESMEHVSPEKLNLSLLQTHSSSPARISVVQGLHKSPLLDRAKTPNLPSAERVFNPLAASPGRHTRSQVKKRKSIGEGDTFTKLDSVSKKVNLNSTPENKIHRNLLHNDSFAGVPTTIHDEDDTLNFLKFLVPQVQAVPQMDSSMAKADGSNQTPPTPDDAIAPELEIQSAPVVEVGQFPATSQGSEETLVLLSAGSSSSSIKSKKDSMCATKSDRGHESTSTYRLINPTEESMTSSVAKLSMRACVKSPFIPPTSISKVKAIDINSPLCASDEDYEDNETVRSSLSLRSINSPASSGSNDDASAVSSTSKKLDDRFQEADTMDLQYIMSGLEQSSIGNNKKTIHSTRRRSSSRFSLSHSMSTDDNTMSSRNFADTLDIQGLLNDESVKNVSMIPIKEDQIEEDVSVAASPKSNMSRVLTSAATPKSILKRNKGMNTKLNVVFCPPTAAEYNIGSPASKFTPMCDEVTRERFQVPIGNLEGNVEQNTVEIDSNINDLLQDISTSDRVFESNPLSYNDVSSSEPSLYHDDTHTVGLEDNLKTALGDVLQEASFASIEDASLRNDEDQDGDRSTDSFMDDADDTHTLALNNVHVVQKMEEDSFSLECNLKSAVQNTEDHTVGLDLDVKALIEMCDKSDRMSVGPQDDESYSLHDKSEGLDEEDYTISLESGMKVMARSFASNYDDTGTLSLRNASVMRPMEGDTIELESDLGNLVGQYSESFYSSTKIEAYNVNEDDTISLHDASIRIVQQSHGDTVELELDSKVFLDKVDSFASKADRSLSDRITISFEEPISESSSIHVHSDSQKNDSVSGSKSSSSNFIKSLEAVVQEDVSEVHDSIELNCSPNLNLSRRMSSRRISLVPPASDRTSSTEDFSGISDLLKDSTDSIAPATPILEEVINLNWTEVSSLFSSLYNDTWFDDIHDFLMQESRNLLSGYNHQEMADFLKEFFYNVCSELDEGADDSICDDAVLSDLIEIPKSTLLCVQKCVRGESSHAAFMELKQKTQILEKASLHVVRYEFVKWEALVANALSSRIVEMKADVDEDELDITRHLAISEKIQESLNILSQERMRLARLEDMTRKKNESDEIELELKSLEEQIAKSENELNTTNNQLDDIDMLLSALSESSRLIPEISDNKSFAQKNFERLQTLEGLQSWKLQKMSETLLSIRFEGYVEHLSFNVHFETLKSGSTRVKLIGLRDSEEIEEHVFIRGNQLTTNVLSFFTYKIHELSMQLSNLVLEDKSGISGIVQDIESFLSRLEIIGKEISRLELRYGGRFQRIDKAYELSVSIQNRFLGKKIYAHFDVSDAYPFAALNMNIDGDIDIDALEKQLCKSACPGYGYLTRTCDMIAAFQGSKK